MDQLVAKLNKARLEYDEAKAASTEAHGRLENVEHEVMNALKLNGKTKYEAEGVGLVYTVTKEVYTTPKTIDDKKRLFDYIKQKYGAESLMAMLGVNHNTLNSWANKETETGEVMEIPGLAQPTAATTLAFRRK